MKYMNVPFFENFTPICSFLLGFKVGRYAVLISYKQRISYSSMELGRKDINLEAK